MRFTIERLRSIILTVGVALIVALGFFLARGTWTNPGKKIDKPSELGRGVQQDALGVTYRHTFGSHAVFEIHATQVTELKNDHALLHGVRIELYDADGRVDRIEGNEFEYDRQAEMATAAGPVEITVMRPGSPTAASPDSAAAPSRSNATMRREDEIHVKTSGLVFYQKTGVATTDKRVDFAVTEGTGNALGATYDSEHGHLVFDRQFELDIRRSGETVDVHAEHGEFERGDMICHLRGASAAYRNGQATAGVAQILFRDDGTAVRLDATNGFALATATGGHVTAPQGWLEFNDNNQPRRAHLEGGVALDSINTSDRADRRSHGSAPMADLEFTDGGNLRHAHLERGVALVSEERSETQAGPQRVSRTWKSPVADVDFRMAGANQVEPALLHGFDGVVVTGESQRGNGAVLPSRLAADDMTVDFGPRSEMRDLKGSGHALLEQTTSAGARQSSTGDRIEAQFSSASSGQAVKPNAVNPKDLRAISSPGAQIASASVVGHVVMNQDPAPKPGETAAPMHATAGRADYEGGGEWIHLTESPRVDDGALQLSANKIDVSQATGEAFAHGNVKATWFAAAGGTPTAHSAGSGEAGLGGQGPSHIVAAEAHLRQFSGEATFRGNARLWQDANSVRAPVIVLNRARETLVATSDNVQEPVHAVLVTVSPARAAADAASDHKAGLHSPSVIRMTGGALRYSDAEHKALMIAGNQGMVVAETPSVRSVSDQVEAILLPQGIRSGKGSGMGQVDTMTANGHVVLTSQGRRGSGARLVYTGENGDYLLTGTAAVPPSMSDPARGVVTGEALIFHSRDDSVSIEGGGNKTLVETRTPK